MWQKIPFQSQGRTLFSCIATGGVSCVRKLAAWLLDYPCPLCRKLNVEPGEGGGRRAENAFCPACLAEIPFITGKRCPGCGGMLSGALALCSKCLNMPKRPWKNAIALFAMRDAGADLIYRYKFGHETMLARVFADLSAPLLAAGNYDEIIPVPLHWTRRLSRGFNQAALLGEELGKRLNLPCCNRLKRTHRTSRQATQNRQHRWNNLKRAFALKRSLDADTLRGKHVLLVDDVLTTGATLTAAAEVLLQSGAAEITVFVLARR